MEPSRPERKRRHVMSTGVPRLALLLLVLGSHCHMLVGRHSNARDAGVGQCPVSTPESPPHDAERMAGYGTLQSLLNSARSTRNGIVRLELPYGFIQEEFSKV